MDTGSFIVHLKTKHVFTKLTKNVERKFDIPNYEVDRPLTNK